jgi:hypothetical protein
MDFNFLAKLVGQQKALGNVPCLRADLSRGMEGAEVLKP